MRQAFSSGETGSPCVCVCFRGVPNLVARKLDLEQALASTGSMGEIAVKHREQLDWLKESGAAVRKELWPRTPRSEERSGARAAVPREGEGRGARSGGEGRLLAASLPIERYQMCMFKNLNDFENFQCFYWSA